MGSWCQNDVKVRDVEIQNQTDRYSCHLKAIWGVTFHNFSLTYTSLQCGNELGKIGSKLPKVQLLTRAIIQTQVCLGSTDFSSHHGPLGFCEPGICLSGHLHLSSVTQMPLGLPLLSALPPTQWCHTPVSSVWHDLPFAFLDPPAGYFWLSSSPSPLRRLSWLISPSSGT